MPQSLAGCVLVDMSLTQRALGLTSIQRDFFECLKCLVNMLSNKTVGARLEERAQQAERGCAFIDMALGALEHRRGSRSHGPCAHLPHISPLLYRRNALASPDTL